MGQALIRRIQNKNKNEDMLKLECKEAFFIQNGGLLLEKRVALSHDTDTGASQVRILSAIEIENVVNRYKPNIVLGQGKFSIIYKGILDGHVVALRVARELEPNPELTDFFITEASTGMVMNHENMVKLLGCCLETCIPILVYEFIPNLCLYEHLHGAMAVWNGALKWVDRLRVATEVAYVLSYMHNALPKTLVHRDVQSNNILFDDLFNAKLAHLGYSVSVVPGKRSEKWPVQGTPGYIDPEYVETQEVTDKCDVYSFGVLLLELLTRRYPPTMVRDDKRADLVDMIASNMGKIMDSDVLDQASSSEIEQVTRLAFECIDKKGVERPTMTEIVNCLRQIQGQHNI